MAPSIKRFRLSLRSRVEQDGASKRRWHRRGCVVISSALAVAAVAAVLLSVGSPDASDETELLAEATAAGGERLCSALRRRLSGCGAPLTLAQRAPCTTTPTWLFGGSLFGEHRCASDDATVDSSADDEQSAAAGSSDVALNRSAHTKVFSIEWIEVVGHHGDPYFTTASKVAEVLKQRGEVGRVTIRRAGSTHVPRWSSAPDRAPFLEFLASLDESIPWESGSPRVAVKYHSEATQLMGADELLLRHERRLRSATFGIGDLADLQALWRQVHSRGAVALWERAYGRSQETGHSEQTTAGHPAFFNADPPGKPIIGPPEDQRTLIEVARGVVLHFDDLGGPWDSYLCHDVQGVKCSMTTQKLDWII